MNHQNITKLLRLRPLIRFFLVLWFVGLVSCSSSSTETTPDETSTDLATFVRWAGHAWDDLVLLLDDSKNVVLDFPVSCEGGGTMDLEGSIITFNDCTETDGTMTYTTDGTHTVTETGALTTHEWTYSLIVDDDTTFSCTGSISFNILGEGIAFDYSGVFTSGTLRLTGVVSDNADGTSDVTFSVLLDGVALYDGLFDDDDLDALSDDDVDAAVTADDDLTCSTLECSTDFECQIFAENDMTDEFETGNIECSSGCCALVEDVATCPGSSPCGDDFTCQLFADDDDTDDFTTDNSSCDLATGCCVTD